MAETRLSKVLIKQQKFNEQGNPVFDEQGNPVYVYTEAPFAADIDDFIVYTDDTGTAHSVKKLVFGDTPPKDFITNGNMWKQLKTQADRCQRTLDNNASFWNGLSNENYQDPSEDGDAGSSHLATGDDINNLKFYGSDYFTSSASKDKLVSLGALEDFAKRIPTLGGLNHSFSEGSVAVGTYDNTIPSGASEGSIAWNGLAQGEKSTAIHGKAYGTNGVAIHGDSGFNGVAIHGDALGNSATALHGTASGDKSIALQGKAEGSNAIAIGPKVNVSASNGVGIGSNLNVDKSAIVLGRYNEPLNDDVRFAVGTGTSQQAKTGLKLNASNSLAGSSPRPTLYTDAFNAHGEWVATCARTSGSQERSTNPIEIKQPLQYWTKAIIVLNGFDKNGNRCASQMVTVMPENLESSGKIYWYAHDMSSSTNSSAIYINISNVEYNNSKLKFTLSASVHDMTTISYACEFTGMAI